MAGETLRFRVATGGCTSAEDFDLQVSRKDRHSVITLYRLRADECKGFFPEGVEIFFDSDQLGLGSDSLIVIENQFSGQASHW
jgi:hypothetical protein